ncbi:MAG: permease-like cell division protein FtsX [Bacteroidota bacterium]|nr:permease-like cell division protein FtsX [Bacteroidota bacterium]
MSINNFEKFEKRRVLNTYFSLVLSISLVLFFLGCLSVLLINSKKISNHFKEQIAITMYLTESIKPFEIKQLENSLLLKEETKKIEFISKDDAAADLIKEIGENFIDFLGYNPLLNSINVYMNSNFVNTISLNNLKEFYEDKEYIQEVIYDQPLVELLNDNLNKISNWLIAICLIFLVISMLLINSSIRLSIHSKRLIIKTMQLVGAKKSFIRRPFITKYLALSLLSSVISISLLIVLIVYLDEKFSSLNLLKYPHEFFIIFSFLILSSVFITLISTYFATQKFLNVNTSHIY